MPKHLLALPEVIAMLEAAKVPKPYVEAFRVQAEAVVAKRVSFTDEAEHFEVGSGYGHVTRKGFVNFRAGDVQHQLTPQKAWQIARFLIGAAEAAASDEIVMSLLRDKVGITDPISAGGILLDLRALRQGTQDTKWEP